MRSRERIEVKERVVVEERERAVEAVGKRLRKNRRGE